MTRIKINRSFVIGILAGCLMTILALILWLMPAVSFKNGELIFTRLPKGIYTVSFKNDLVDISVADLPFARDVPFEINWIAHCKDHKYGSMVGYPYDGIFYFEYTNASMDIHNSPPINDVDRSHPRSKMKNAQQDATSNPYQPPSFDD